MQEDLVTFQEVRQSECTPLNLQAEDEGLAFLETELKHFRADETEDQEIWSSGESEKLPKDRNQLSRDNSTSYEESLQPCLVQVMEESIDSEKESRRYNSSFQEDYQCPTKYLTNLDKEDGEHEIYPRKSSKERSQLQERIQEVERLLEMKALETEEGRKQIQKMEKTLRILEVQNEEDSQKLIRLQGGLDTFAKEHENVQRTKSLGALKEHITTESMAHPVETEVDGQTAVKVPMIKGQDFLVPVKEEEDGFSKETEVHSKKLCREDKLYFQERLRELQEDFRKQVSESAETKKMIAFLQKEASQIKEKRNELLHVGKSLQSEHACLKEEFQLFEKCLDLKFNEVEKLNTKVEFLEKEKEETIWNYNMLASENKRLKSEIKVVEDDFALQGDQLEAMRKEVERLTKGSEEVHENRLVIEDRLERLKKKVRELEDELEYEAESHAKTKKMLNNLTKEKKHMESRIKYLQDEADQREQDFLELKGRKHSKSKKLRDLTQNLTVAATNERQLENLLAEERRKSDCLEEQNDELESTIAALKEDIEVMVKEDEIEKTLLHEELVELRPLRRRANMLTEELEQVKEKLQQENRSDQKEALMFELETMRHRLVSNVVKPLEEASLIRVNVADISNGRNKAWSKVKEMITSLIQDRERINTESTKLYQAWTLLKQNYKTKLEECEKLQEERSEISEVSCQ